MHNIAVMNNLIKKILLFRMRKREWNYLALKHCSNLSNEAMGLIQLNEIAYSCIHS